MRKQIHINNNLTILFCFSSCFQTPTSSERQRVECFGTLPKDVYLNEAPYSPSISSSSPSSPPVDPLWRPTVPPHFYGSPADTASRSSTGPRRPCTTGGGHPRTGTLSLGKGLFKIRRRGSGSAWTSSAPNLGKGLSVCLSLCPSCLSVCLSVFHWLILFH